MWSSDFINNLVGELKSPQYEQIRHSVTIKSERHKWANHYETDEIGTPTLTPIVKDIIKNMSFADKFKQLPIIHEEDEEDDGGAQVEPGDKVKAAGTVHN